MEPTRDHDPDVTVDDVTVTFDGRDALAGLSLEVARGEVVAVVGPSGAGKSTLLELICGLRTPDRGRVVSGRAVLMPQRDALLPWLRADDNAALPLRLAGEPSDRARRRAHALLAEFGLAGSERARIDELSGGMRQRVAFARTLLSGAPVLCLDEPFGALDAITRSGLQRWLAGVLAREQRTVVLVTHDVEEAALLADRVLVLAPRPGRIVSELPVAPPRPRSPGDAAVIAARSAATAALAAGGGPP